MVSEIEKREVDKLASLLGVNKEEALRLALEAMNFVSEKQPSFTFQERQV
ncbi:MAG: hypothetical protein U9O85_00715 [Euryarchaeota archaeon]|nr:hypothetical protein [Euryarchaeota archaeon]